MVVVFSIVLSFQSNGFSCCCCCYYYYWCLPLLLNAHTRVTVFMRPKRRWLPERISFEFHLLDYEHKHFVRFECLSNNNYEFIDVNRIRIHFFLFLVVVVVVVWFCVLFSRIYPVVCIMQINECLMFVVDERRKSTYWTVQHSDICINSVIFAYHPFGSIIMPLQRNQITLSLTLEREKPKATYTHNNKKKQTTNYSRSFAFLNRQLYHWSMWGCRRSNNAKRL